MPRKSALGMSTWVFALAALAELGEGERLNASDVMRRALALSRGEAGVYLDAVKRALESLADDGAAEMERVAEKKGGQPQVLWNITLDGRERWANLCTVFGELAALTRKNNQHASAFARAGARAG
jgi:predicted ArsR family transcriptional regulator